MCVTAALALWGTAAWTLTSTVPATAPGQPPRHPDRRAEHRGAGLPSYGIGSKLSYAVQAPEADPA
ncbi:hypothetical protein ACFWUQ_03365 [Streptomyces sp. NPDC058662]|uniref:hypothetical protein n=1 Tax=Streptomyces sp. NPDC058662 TaxID=3346583 RepID=UPI00365875DA